MPTEVQSQGETSTKRAIRSSSAICEWSLRNLSIWTTLVLMIAINVFPLIYSLFLSFTDYSAIAKEAPVWIGFENFAKILSDEKMWFFFTTTGKYVLFSVSLQLIFGFILALLLREKFFA